MWQYTKHWWNRPCGAREVLILALPLVISTSSWTLMLFIDRMFLLWHSPDALAAALPAGLLNFTVISFFLGIAAYVNTFVAQYHGAKRPERIGIAVWQGVAVGVIAIPITLLTIPLAPKLFEYANHGPAIMELEVSYYQILCYGAAGMVFSAALSAFFTGRGRTSTVMMVDCSAALLNIVLDYAWIFGNFGFAAQGIEGAGWATVIANWCRAGFYLALMLRATNRLEFGTLSGCRFEPKLFRRLLSYGFPSGMQYVLEVGAFTAFLMLVGRLGPLELTATNLAFNLNSLAFLPLLGFGIATTTLVGQRLGENRPDLAARATWTTYILASGYMSILAALYVLAPDLLLFAHGAKADPAEFARVRDLTVVLLRFVAAFGLLDTMNVIFVSAIKGAGDTRFVLWITCGMAAMPVVPTWIGMAYFDLGLYWSWCVVTVWVWALGAAYLGRFLQGKWRTMRVIESHYVAGVHEQPVEPLPAVTGDTL